MNFLNIVSGVDYRKRYITSVCLILIIVFLNCLSLKSLVKFSLIIQKLDMWSLGQLDRLISWTNLHEEHNHK